MYRTILLSVISLLNEPNTSSAANVDASVLYRKWRDSRGKDKQYIELITYASIYLHTWWEEKGVGIGNWKREDEYGY